jgi:hypothetical protein
MHARHGLNHALIAEGIQDHGDRESVVGPKTNFVPGHAYDAGISRAKHLNAGSAAKAKLFQTMDVVGRSLDARNPCRLAGSQLLQGNGAVMHGGH